MHDYLIVGAGLCGAVLAERLNAAGASVAVVEKREHPGGNLYCEDFDGITVHRYGAHIFRTSDPVVWTYVNRFVTFNRFTNSPVANYKGELYNLPFNMNTFRQLFGVRTPDEAKKAIQTDCVPCESPKNLEEHVLATVGKTVYEKLIKGYTEKQWGKPCNELPASIMRRIPLRFTYDNNYFNDRWQGIPEEGYNTMISRMLDGVPVILSTDFNKNRDSLKRIARQVIYTGPVDALFDEKHGRLGYRSLKFKDRLMASNNQQGVAVMNYTDKETPYTRVIEHKHFLFGDDLPYSICTEEYPQEYTGDAEPYYPIETAGNLGLYQTYKGMAQKEGYILCGRLAEYRYYDMQDTISSAIKTALDLCKGESA